MGTVFGRFLSKRLAFEHVTTVRFAFGLIASACVLPIVGAAAFSNLHDSVWIAVLALVTGLFALGLYYYGLQRTPAPLAALGELRFRSPPRWSASTSSTTRCAGRSGSASRSPWE